MKERNDLSDTTNLSASRKEAPGKKLLCLGIGRGNCKRKHPHNFFCAFTPVCLMDLQTVNKP